MSVFHNFQETGPHGLSLQYMEIILHNFNHTIFQTQVNNNYFKENPSQ